MSLARRVEAPCVETLHPPFTYRPSQVGRAIMIAQHAGELGGTRGYVYGDDGRQALLGIEGDRGVLVLAEPPQGEHA